MRKEKSLKTQIDQVTNSGLPTIFFITRLGELASISLKKEHAEDEEVFVRLHERAGNPHFEICTVVNGVVHGRSDVIKTDEETLNHAIEDAEAERKRFYSERIETYGDAALPRQCR